MQPMQPDLAGHMLGMTNIKYSNLKKIGKVGKVGTYLRARVVFFCSEHV